MHALGKGEVLFRHLSRGLQLPPHEMKAPQGRQSQKELRRFSQLLTQLLHAGVGPCYFRGRIALGGHQCNSERQLQREFLLGALWGLRQSLEQLQPFRQVTNRFHIGRAIAGSLRCLLQILDGAAVIPPLLKVDRELDRNLACLSAIGRFLPLADPQLEPLAAARH